MAVLNSVIGRVKPGRYEDFISQALEATKLYERLGANNVRMFSAGVAGEAFGTWTFTSEYESMEAYGAFSDELMVDSEMQALMMRIQSPDNPSTIESINVAVEIPVRKSKGGRGALSVVNVSRTHPGGLERSLALGARACEFVERHGAVDARMFDLVAAGLGAGMSISTWEFENARAWGKAIDAFNTDPEGQAIALEAMAPDAPLTRVFEGVYTQIPL
jgi:hypothetical protein